MPAVAPEARTAGFGDGVGVLVSIVEVTLGLGVAVSVLDAVVMRDVGVDVGVGVVYPC